MNLYGHATVAQIEKEYGLDVDSIEQRIIKKWRIGYEQNKKKNF